MGNFARIYISFFNITASTWHDKCNFHYIHIFTDIKETRITRKYVQRGNFYVQSIQVNTGSTPSSGLVPRLWGGEWLSGRRPDQGAPII